MLLLNWSKISVVVGIDIVIKFLAPVLAHLPAIRAPKLFFLYQACNCLVILTYDGTDTGYGIHCIVHISLLFPISAPLY